MESEQEMFYLRKIKELKEIVKQIAPKLPYHNFTHAIEVSKACKDYAILEGLSSYKAFILETAGLLHDIIYVQGRSDNEEKSAGASRKILSKLSYSAEEIEEVSRLILATRSPRSRKDILERIINDADLDNLGRNDFFKKSELLRKEIGADKEKWNNELQINFLSQAKYHTNSAKKLREAKLKENLEKIRRTKW